MSSGFRALRSRNYRLWALGAVVSNTGTWMQRVAQSWLVLTVLTDNSGLATGITIGLQFLPLLLFSPYAGVLADRLPKRRVLMCTQTLMGLTSLVLGLLTLSGAIELWHVYGCALVFGVGTALDNPARFAFVSEVVPRQDVPSAVGLNSANMNIARLTGPGLAGLLIAAAGTGPVFLINAASFAAVLLALARMRPADMQPAVPLPRAKGQVREGIRYVWDRPDLLLIIVSAGVICTLAYNSQVTAALMANDVYHLGPEGYGLFGSAMGIGSLAGALVNARRTRLRLTLVVGAAFGLGLALTAAAVAPQAITHAVLMIPVGIASITFLNSCNTAVQLSTPRQFRGRIMALYLVVQQGTTPIGAPLVGWLGSALGARWSLLVGGFAALAMATAATVAVRRRPRIGEVFELSLAEQAEADDACRVVRVPAPRRVVRVPSRRGR